MSKHSTDGTNDRPSFPMDDATWQSISKKLAFSPQQKRIVELILRDQSDKEIADELRLTVPTVRTHLARIFDRTDTTSRLNLVLRIFSMIHNPTTTRCSHQ